MIAKTAIALAAVGAALTIASLPELRRYFQIRRM